ncbi:MAG: nuclear transport factor 2 family protein [Micropepsaceae bacterium]
MTATILAAAGGPGLVAAASTSPAVALAQGQLDAYNAQDLEKFLSFYADDIIVADLNGAITNNGIAALRERYAAMFAKFPENKALLVNRIANGNTVIDHEDVIRSPGGERFFAIAIYTIAGGKIARVDFAKA